MIDVIRVSSRGQIVIPEDMRKELDIKKGTKLVAIAGKDGIILKKERESLKDILRGWSQEDKQWFSLATQSFEEVWDNKEDDVWNKKTSSS